MLPVNSVQATSKYWEDYCHSSLKNKNKKKTIIQKVRDDYLENLREKEQVPLVTEFLSDNVEMELTVLSIALIPVANVPLFI